MVIVTAMSAPSMMTTVATAAALLTVADGFKISGTVGGTDVDLKASTQRSDRVTESLKFLLVQFCADLPL